MAAKWSTLGLNGPHCVTCEPAREGQTRSYRRPPGPPSQAVSTRYLDRQALSRPGAECSEVAFTEDQQVGRGVSNNRNLLSHRYRHLFSPSSGSQISELPVDRATRALGSRGGASPVSCHFRGSRHPWLMATSPQFLPLSSCGLLPMCLRPLLFSPCRQSLDLGP